MEQWIGALRQTVIFLQANNIPDVHLMPLGYMWHQAQYLRGIINKQTATEMLGFQAAASSIMSKEGGKFFTKMVEGLQND